MKIIDYINESGQHCQVCFTDEIDKKFDWVMGTYPNTKTYTKTGLYFQKKFEDKMKKCKIINVAVEVE